MRILVATVGVLGLAGCEGGFNPERWTFSANPVCVFICVAGTSNSTGLK